MSKNIILVSSSPRRRELLSQAGFKFRVFKVKTKEIKNSKRPPKKIVIINAKGKIEKARGKFKSGILLAADTLIYFRGKVLGKPKNIKEAKNMLKLLSGCTHQVFTGVVVLSLDAKKCITGCEVSRVTFKKLSDKTIEKYIKSVNTIDKAAAYALQEKGSLIIKKVAGPRDNIVGLPVEKVKNILSLLNS